VFFFCSKPNAAFLVRASIIVKVPTSVCASALFCLSRSAYFQHLVGVPSMKICILKLATATR
jgi:hypothetical protein